MVDLTKLTYKVISHKDITPVIAEQCIELLLKQQKVHPPNIIRIQSCRQIIMCYINDHLVAMGALKQKTSRDFDSNKADLEKLNTSFEWEIGYFYTEVEFRGLSIAKTIAKLLLRNKENENLMASTELYSENSMRYILEHLGFRLYGTPWKSGIHDGFLGLFLKFKKGEINH